LDANTIEQGAIDLNCGDATMLHLEVLDGKLSASVEKDSISFKVQPEYMRDFHKITTPEILAKFLANAFVKVIQVSDGEFKFEVNQKAKGGSRQEYLFAKKHMASEVRINPACFQGVGDAFSTNMAGGTLLAKTFKINNPVPTILFDSSTSALSTLGTNALNGKCNFTITPNKSTFWK
jgi:hypothetical protein